MDIKVIDRRVNRDQDTGNPDKFNPDTLSPDTLNSGTENLIAFSKVGLQMVEPVAKLYKLRLSRIT